MSTNELLNLALQMSPEDRFVLVDGIIQSLEQPDEALNEAWVHEAERRLAAYRAGEMEVVSAEQLFQKD